MQAKSENPKYLNLLFHFDFLPSFLIILVIRLNTEGVMAEPNLEVFKVDPALVWHVRHATDLCHVLLWPS